MTSEDLVKGYKFQKNQYVHFEKEELDQLLPESNKEIKTLDFVSIDEVDPIYFQKNILSIPRWQSG
ncbi:Ku protein [Paenibacillus pini]|uniref:Ku protein n=1 Tax=Paenibacillus pini TaxID=669461 RepID=UPI003571528E